MIWVHRLHKIKAPKTFKNSQKSKKNRWCRHEDSNPGPEVYKTPALPTELCRHFPSLLILVDLIYALRISPCKVALQKETRKLISASPRNNLGAILLLLGGGRADLRKALKPWHLKISQILSGRKQVMQWLDLGNSRPIPSQYQIMWHPQLI